MPKKTTVIDSVKGAIAGPTEPRPGEFLQVPVFDAFIEIFVVSESAELTET